MTWENILKADFSFRDVIRNSRGVYARIFDRIQMTPDLSKLGGEVVLIEPMLIGLDMMNDPSMEKDLDNLMEMRVTSISQEEDEEGEEALSPEQIDTIEEIANKAANKVVSEIKQSIEKTLENKLGEELIGAEKQEVMEGLVEVVSSQEFVGYAAVVLNALIIKVAKESIQTKPFRKTSWKQTKWIGFHKLSGDSLVAGDS